MTTKAAMVWHDITCPEGEECRDRVLHSMSSPIVNAGLLDRFLDKMSQVSQGFSAKVSPSVAGRLDPTVYETSVPRDGLAGIRRRDGEPFTQADWAEVLRLVNQETNPALRKGHWG